MVKIPTPSLEQLMWYLLGLLSGLPAPYWYAAERIKGFTRVMLSKLPYKPPPGKSKDEALEEAVAHEDKQDSDEQDNEE